MLYASPSRGFIFLRFWPGVFRGAWLREEAASVGGLFVVVLIGKNLLVEFKLFNQPLDFLHADIAGHDQPEAGILCGLFRPVPVTSPAPRR